MKAEDQELLEVLQEEAEVASEEMVISEAIEAETEVTTAIEIREIEGQLMKDKNEK